jgi:hypothetical protein
VSRVYISFFVRVLSSCMMLVAMIDVIYFWKFWCYVHVVYVLLVACESDSSHVPRSASSLSQFGCGEEHGFA